MFTNERYQKHMNRDEQIEQLNQTPEWDFLVIGGGASGLGTAIDAVSRGFKTILLEGVDFAKGTSSRSTKLVHGGVRYLAQGHLGLVTEALEERGLMAQNSPHLFKNQTFIIPNYKWWEGLYYAIGLKIYDLLSKKFSLGKSKLISKKEIIRNLPTLNKEHIVSGVTYQDGQFDDSRLAINLAQTAFDHGATILNHMKVVDLVKDNEGKVVGVKVIDSETQKSHTIKSKAVVNATGIFTNEILNMNDPQHKKTVVPSQGVHLVLDQSFLQSTRAIMIPKTSDGRVLFVIPWHGKVVVGTTDTLIKKTSFEPQALESEIEFILKTAASYLSKRPGRKDVLSIFVGLRPLAAPAEEGMSTKEVSRSHKIIVSDSNLITIIGGKWTTYRKMAESIVNKAIDIHNLPKQATKTKELKIHGHTNGMQVTENDHRYVYGSDLEELKQLQSKNSDYQRIVHPKYKYTVAEIIWSIRNEMARTVEDILARRVRLLFLDARAAIEAAPLVSQILAKELDRNEDWAKNQETEFIKLAQNYILT